jgi:hypothetical protein
MKSLGNSMFMKQVYQGTNLFEFYCLMELTSKEIFSLIPAIVLCTLTCLKHVSSSE